MDFDAANFLILCQLSIGNDYEIFIPLHVLLVVSNALLLGRVITNIMVPLSEGKFSKIMECVKQNTFYIDY